MINVDYRKYLWSEGYWEIPEGIDTTNFDFTWRPDPYDRPYIHQFGTQHQKTGGPRFIIPEDEGVKYQNHQHAIKIANPNDRCWRPLIANCTIDLSWHPDDTEPPFIYVFFNQWHDSPAYQYRVSGATDKKYITQLKAYLLPDKKHWEIPEGIDDSTFDYSWIPNPYDPPLIYQFGTQWQKTGGPRYIVEGATEVKYINIQKVNNLPDMRKWRILEEIDTDAFDFSWHPDDTEPPMMYEFGTQWQKAGGPIYVAKGSTQKKYCNDQIAIRKAIENRCYRPLVANAEFDLSWHPDPNEPPYMYIFGNQWYDSVTMPTILYHVKGATDKKYIDDIKATLLPDKTKFKVLEDVESFDYSWVPNPNDPPMNYIFGNKFHSPEFMPTIMYRVKGAMDTKYVKDIKATLKIDSIQCEDSIFDKMKSHVFETKYTYFNTDSSVDYDIVFDNDEKLYVHLIDNVGAIVPREAKINLFDKVTDYPYVKRHSLGNKNPLLDIVFFSNGEACAEANYKHLISLNLPNRIVRIDKVKGRVASQHAAANASNTPWYFLVNAKLKVNADFDFSWHPDIFKSNRHYIFTATNPVNNLKYGHQAIVANNKTLTMNTVVKGLDFTMDSPTEVVNLNSGIAMYNTSIWDTWRTAFRECIKLSYANDNESKFRLNAWLMIGNSEYGEHSIRGATDAVNYYYSVNGDLNKLMLSYDWAWLHELFVKQYE